MATQTVGIREFRENLSSYILKADGPIAIQRHGDTVGFFLPSPRKRLTDEQKRKLIEDGREMERMLAAAGVTEDEIVEEFQRVRKAERVKSKAA